MVSISISMSKALLQNGRLKSEKRKIETLCILCNDECSEQCKLEEVTWNSMREKGKAWIGLDTFGTVSDSRLALDWRNGPEIYFLHNNCKSKLHNARLLDQAKKWKEKKDQKKERKSFAEKSIISSDETSNSATSTRRSSIGPIYSKDFCIWCLKPEDTYYKDSKNSKLHLINQG